MKLFGTLLDLKSENLKLENGRKNPDVCCQNFQPQMMFVDFLDFRTVKNRNLFLDSKLTN